MGEQWDAWTTRPGEPKKTKPTRQQEVNSISVRSLIALLSMLLLVVGGFMQFSSVDLWNGSNMLWIGTGLAVAGLVAAFCSEKLPLLILAGIVATACIVHSVYVEDQLRQTRLEIGNAYDKFKKSYPGSLG